MNGCDEVLLAVLDELAASSAWRCRPLGDGSAFRVTTDRVLVDSEPVHILVRLRQGVAVMSDGGETLARLADQGLDLDDNVLAGLWDEALRTYRLQAQDGRVFLESQVEMASSALVRFADSLVALDALRVSSVPLQRHQPTLADEVEAFLRDRYESRRVHRSPMVTLAEGLVIRPTLRVDTEHRSGVLIQTGTAGSPTQSYDHAFSIFGLARHGRVPQENCLALLGGELGSWNHARLRVLCDVAYVGFWKYRDRVEAFLDGEIPPDPLMAPHGLESPLTGA